MSEVVQVFPSQTRKMLRENPVPKEIAKELGVNLATVYRHAKGMDLKLIADMKSLRWDTKEMVRFLSQELRYTNSNIATALGVTLPYVSEALNG